MINWGKSPTYIWDESSTIGQGQFANVYKGAHNKTGEEVAIKKFKVPIENDTREMEMLRKTSHKNIVKLLAIEEDAWNGKIIVMELCTGGSLQDALNKPENQFGLPEKEFLLVLEHLCAGMKHLRENQIIHRDIKPLNIMKFISDDGQSIYKLTDFGAARELEENQPFATLCGTEQYLHPDLYESMVLRKPIKCSHLVDLWSIGVTLYHLATGQLPFSSNGTNLRERCRVAMHKILKTKPIGVISGKELPNDTIDWSNELPEHCQLSKGLKLLITPLLAGLLEANKDRAWSFDRYFKEVTLISRKIIIHVFFMHRVNSLRVFLDPDQQIDNFREGILQQTKLPVKKQILLFNSEVLEKSITPRLPAKAFPATTMQNPVYLWSSVDVDVQLPQQKQLQSFGKVEKYDSLKDCIEFAEISHRTCCEYTSRIHDCTTSDILTENGVKQLTKMLITQIKGLMTKGILIKYSGNYELSMENFCSHVENAAVKLLLNKFRELQNTLAGINEAVQQINKQFVLDDKLKENWNKLTDSKNRPCRIRANQKAHNIAEQLNVNWQFLCKQLENNKEKPEQCFYRQIRDLEMIKIKNNIKNITTLLLDDVLPAVTQMSECLAEWYKLAQTVYVKIIILTNNLHNCQRDFCETRKELSNQIAIILSPEEANAILRESEELINFFKICK